MNRNLRTVAHKPQFCVIGGGMSGLCAAVAAARRGTKVVLIHDRPVLGGNASSEIRMWICGARGENNRETGILEEIALETCYRNPYRTYPIWDSILFDLVKREKNLTLLLNCSCCDAEMDGDRIAKVMAWQGTTQTWHTVEAALFADCSGDSILAPLAGAEFRMGREAREEFGESIAPEIADAKTMGNSCLIQAREMSGKRDFIPPEQTRRFTREQLQHRHPNMDSPYENYWYMELGGEQHTIDEAEEIRDELIRVAHGVWDYIKNSGNCQADNWELDFLGYLPGKRESRRYVGDHVLTQDDVQTGGHFDDLIAYGGWPMDDHNPAGINTTEPPNINYFSTSPFGIPYRCLYSKNISNLFFAGRNISVTHSAMSASRVMATCAILGQAVGNAAALAVQYDSTPRGVYEDHITELKQSLMEDDCFLPFNKMEMSPITQAAKITATCGDPEVLRDGYDRPDEENTHAWLAGVGDSVAYAFEKQRVEELRLVFDSDLNRKTVNDDGYLPDKISICNIPAKYDPLRVPKTLVMHAKVEILADGQWQEIPGVEQNHFRLVKLPVGREAEAVRVTVLETWGNEKVGIQSMDVR